MMEWWNDGGGRSTEELDEPKFRLGAALVPVSQSSSFIKHGNVFVLLLIFGPPYGIIYALVAPWRATLERVASWERTLDLRMMNYDW